MFHVIVRSQKRNISIERCLNRKLPSGYLKNERAFLKADKIKNGAEESVKKSAELMNEKGKNLPSWQKILSPKNPGWLLVLPIVGWLFYKKYKEAELANQNPLKPVERRFR